jgi:hypothetical protein
VCVVVAWKKVLMLKHVSWVPVLMYLTRRHTPEEVKAIQVLFFLDILLPISCFRRLMCSHSHIAVWNVLCP